MLDIDYYRTAAHSGISDQIAGEKYDPGTGSRPWSPEMIERATGYSDGWILAGNIADQHRYVLRDNGKHGYPYQAFCPCGWQSATYAAAHAADSMAQVHIKALALNALDGH